MTFLEHIQKRKNPNRSLTEILVEADNSTTFPQLTMLSNELMENRGRFEYYEVEYGLEHIKELGQILQDKHLLKQMMNE